MKNLSIYFIFRLKKNNKVEVLRWTQEGKVLDSSLVSCQSHDYAICKRWIIHLTHREERVSLTVEFLCLSCLAVNDRQETVFSTAFLRMKIPTLLVLSFLSKSVLWGGWLQFLTEGNQGKTLHFFFPIFNQQYLRNKVEKNRFLYLFLGKFFFESIIGLLI